MPRQAAAAGPKYRRIAQDLLASIESGEYPPGSRLPTKAELMKRYEVAINTVERAVEELRTGGHVETVQGAGMFVREPGPDITASAAPEAQRLERLESKVAELQEQMGHMQAQLIDLYHSSGRAYPYESETAEHGRQVG